MQALPVLDGFVHPQQGEQSFQVLVDLPPLIPGQYWISPWVGSHNTETLDMIHQCAAFEVSHSPTLARSFPHYIEHGYIVPPSRLASDGRRDVDLLGQNVVDRIAFTLRSAEVSNNEG
jgi:lipopolysaccharide transport system ATP-binding protein